MPKNLSKVLEKFQGTLFKLDGLDFLSDIVFASTKCRLLYILLRKSPTLSFALECYLSLLLFASIKFLNLGHRSRYPSLVG